MRFTFAAGVLFLSVPVLTQAAPFIVDPTVANVSSEYNSDPTERNKNKAGDGSGLSDPSIVETNDPVPAIYPADDANYYNNWLTAANATNVYITYDLGAVYTLSGLHVWNYNENFNGFSGTQRGANSVSISGSTTSDTTGFGPAESTTFQQVPSGTFASQSTYTGQDYTFATPLTARYVRININSNFGDPYTGLGEARFVAVPEPTALTAVAFGVLPLMRRRRRAC